VDTELIHELMKRKIIRENMRKARLEAGERNFMLEAYHKKTHFKAA
jgi:hypothetical protein